MLIGKLCFVCVSLCLFSCLLYGALSYVEYLCFVVLIASCLCIKLFTCFTSCLLDRNLLVTLYLSFYFLLYLEDLMCFVQVFQVTSIYVPSSSQLL